MSDSLREALIGDHLISEVFANDVLVAIARWLEHRAVRLQRDNPLNTPAAMELVATAGVIRREVSDAG